MLSRGQTSSLSVHLSPTSSITCPSRVSTYWPSVQRNLTMTYLTVSDNIFCFPSASKGLIKWLCDTMNPAAEPSLLLTLGSRGSSYDNTGADNDVESELIPGLKRIQHLIQTNCCLLCQNHKPAHDMIAVWDEFDDTANWNSKEDAGVFFVSVCWRTHWQENSSRTAQKQEQSSENNSLCSHSLCEISHLLFPFFVTIWLSN